MWKKSSQKKPKSEKKKKREKLKNIMNFSNASLRVLDAAILEHEHWWLRWSNLAYQACMHLHLKSYSTNFDAKLASHSQVMAGEEPPRFSNKIRHQCGFEPNINYSNASLSGLGRKMLLQEHRWWQFSDLAYQPCMHQHIKNFSTNFDAKLASHS